MVITIATSVGRILLCARAISLHWNANVTRYLKGIKPCVLQYLTFICMSLQSRPRIFNEFWRIEAIWFVFINMTNHISLKKKHLYRNVRTDHEEHNATRSRRTLPRRITFSRQRRRQQKTTTQQQRHNHQQQPPRSIAGASGATTSRQCILSLPDTWP